MLKVDFYELGTIEDSKLIFAVVLPRYKDKWVLVKHKQRDTWEIPGGHREVAESIDACASRELIEETGAKDFKIKPVCIYSVEKEGVILDYGQVYYIDVESFGELPDSEIEKIEFFDELPDNLTYPLINPFIFKKVLEIL